MARVFLLPLPITFTTINKKLYAVVTSVSSNITATQRFNINFSQKKVIKRNMFTYKRVSESMARQQLGAILSTRYCSCPFPWRGSQRAWRIRGSGSHPQCAAHSSVASPQCTVRRGSVWSVPRTAAARWGAAAAAGLPGTCSWLSLFELFRYLSLN